MNQVKNKQLCSNNDFMSSRSKHSSYDHARPGVNRNIPAHKHHYSKESSSKRRQLVQNKRLAQQKAHYNEQSIPLIHCKQSATYQGHPMVHEFIHEFIHQVTPS
ncbi:hypothetical protein D3C73_1188340 [compost metagenome]